MKRIFITTAILLAIIGQAGFLVIMAGQPRSVSNFCKDWRFNLGDVSNAQDSFFDDTKWRSLNFPHDCGVWKASSTKKIHPRQVVGHYQAA